MSDFRYVPNRVQLQGMLTGVKLNDFMSASPPFKVLILTFNHSFEVQMFSSESIRIEDLDVLYSVFKRIINARQTSPSNDPHYDPAVGLVPPQELLG